MIEFKTWYEFRDAVEASIENGKDTYIFAMEETDPHIGIYMLDICNDSNEFYVSTQFNMDDFQKYLFVKYNAMNKCNDYSIVLDWVYDENLIYKRLFIFKTSGE